MKHSKDANPDTHILVLARAADPMCTLLSTFLREQNLFFSAVNNIYQALAQMRTDVASQRVVLIARLGMLAPDALKAMLDQVGRLKIVAWCDRDQTVADVSFCQIAGYGVVPVADLHQLSQVLDALTDAGTPQQPIAQVPMNKEERLKYDISDEEMNMLLETAK